MNPISLMDPNCNRCHKPATSKTMSRFNTQMICETCEEREKAHPKYAEAEEAERQAVKAGNYNFPGIGLPPGL